MWTFVQSEQLSFFICVSVHIRFEWGATPVLPVHSLYYPPLQNVLLAHFLFWLYGLRVVCVSVEGRGLVLATDAAISSERDGGIRKWDGG